jgi:glycosyltransferase involved in cell wall biosynthesis
MSKPSKVLWIVLDSRHIGGIETHVLQLAEGLQQHGIELQVIFLADYGPHPLRTALSEKHIVHLSLDGSIRNLWKQMNTHTPALIHTHGYKAGIYGRLCGHFSSIPVVSTYHSGEICSGRLALYDCIDRYSSALASKVYVVSPDIAQRIPVETELVQNFIATKGVKLSTGKQIAFVGRLSHEKGPDIYLRLARCFPKQTFHVYGTGSLEDQLKRDASDNVHFHGQQSDMSVVWPNIGLLVMPSRFEGLPMAALEAMGRGIPVMAYNVGALSHLITNNKNGWIIEPMKLEHLSYQLRKWLAISESTKSQYRQAARITVEEKFSTQVAIPQLILTYAGLAQNKIANCIAN